MSIERRTKPDYCPLGKNARFLRQTGQLRDGVDIELGGDRGAVEFHGALVDAEVRGNLFVELPLHDQGEYFALAMRQRIQAGAQLL